MPIVIRTWRIWEKSTAHCRYWQLRVKSIQGRPGLDQVLFLYQVLILLFKFVCGQTSGNASAEPLLWDNCYLQVSWTAEPVCVSNGTRSWTTDGNAISPDCHRTHAECFAAPGESKPVPEEDKGNEPRGHCEISNRVTNVTNIAMRNVDECIRSGKTRGQKKRRGKGRRAKKQFFLLAAAWVSPGRSPSVS